MTPCLCLAGLQTRYEQGRGQVEMPCPICEHKRWEEYWREREKREKGQRKAAAVAQDAMERAG